MFNFNAPIPGESLTKELGGYAWENPPKFDLLEDAFDDYFENLKDDEVKEDIFLLLDIGVPLDVVIETMTLTGVMKGRHTIDLQILLIPLLTEYVKALADVTGVEYINSVEELENTPEAIKEKKDRKLVARLTAELEGVSAKKIKEDTGLALIQSVKDKIIEDDTSTMPSEDTDIVVDKKDDIQPSIDTPRKGLMRKERQDD